MRRKLDDPPSDCGGDAVQAKLFRSGAGADVRSRAGSTCAPITHGWGRTPVLARVDGRAGRPRSGATRSTLGPSRAQAIRGEKSDGDLVMVEIIERDAPQPVASPEPIWTVGTAYS